MKELSIFGDGTFSDSPLITRQRRLNCFYDVRQDGDKHKSILRGTPGTLASFALPKSPLRGFRVVGNTLYVVAGNGLYSVNTSGVVSASLGMLSSNSGLVDMTDNQLQLGIVDGQVGYCYTLVTGSYSQTALNTAGSFGQISDTNFPNGSTSVDFLDSYVVANAPNSQQFFVSAFKDLTKWTNASSLPTYGIKDNYSDVVSKIRVVNGLLIPMGARSMEFWQDAGTSPMPFARINGATATWGLAAVNSIVPFNGSLAFLAQPAEGGVQVCMLNGYVPQRISNDDIEDLITSFPTWQDAIALTYTAHGHKFLQLTFPSGNRTLLYDATGVGFWSEAQTGLDMVGRHIGNIGVTFNTANYLSDSTSGLMYKFSDTTYTDNGVSIKRQFASRHIHADGNQFTLGKLFLDFDTGRGLQSGQGSDPQIILQVSTNNGRNFGKEKWKSIGKVGQYLTRVIYKRLGRARDFVLMWTLTDPVPFTAIHGSAVMIDIEQ